MLTKTERQAFLEMAGPLVRDAFKQFMDEITKMAAKFVIDFLKNENEMRVELRTLIVAHLKDKS